MKQLENGNSHQDFGHGCSRILGALSITNMAALNNKALTGATGQGRLDGKVALVTGGSLGFGAAIIKKFQTEGARVVAVDISPTLTQSVSESYPDGSVVAVIGDVSRVETWTTALDTALKRFGKLDIVVNNAGVIYDNTPSHEVEEAEFDRLMRINVKSLFWSCKIIVPYLQARGEGGNFINLSSTGASRPRPGVTWYSASKGAVSIMTKSLGVEYAPNKIRFNALLPALGETGMLPKVLGKADTAENRAPILASIPLGRFTQGTDVANAACFLASDEACFITGVCMEVDGGRCI
ncbi:4-formylbenzenesulfonate dehydrogenase TsaC1/TsaC2 [Exophiala dermatitidis]